MTYLISIIVFASAFALLGIGYLVARKTLKKGCSLGPDCTCKNEGKPQEDCDHLIT